MTRFGSGAKILIWVVAILLLIEFSGAYLIDSSGLSFWGIFGGLLCLLCLAIFSGLIFWIVWLSVAKEHYPDWLRERRFKIIEKSFIYSGIILIVLAIICDLWMVIKWIVTLRGISFLLAGVFLHRGYEKVYS